MDSGYRVLQETAGYLRRGDRGRLLLRGVDRRAYLHGLLTNDIVALSAGTGCYAALLTPQGRMIADMRVFELGDAVLIDLEREATSGVRDHLDRFVITEDVAVEDVSESLAQIGVYGPHSAAVLGDVLLPDGSSGEPSPGAGRVEALRAFENRRLSFAGQPVFVLRSDDRGVNGFDLVLEADRAEELIGALGSAGAAPVGHEEMEITRIEAGIPRFGVDMDATTIPLEAGIEERAISMTKGCYVGQEVIIRVLHRGGGRVAKKLVQLEASAPIASGDPIFSGEREIGKVTSATASPRFGGFVALGYVQRDFAVEGTPVRIGSVEGRVNP